MGDVLPMEDMQTEDLIVKSLTDSAELKLRVARELKSVIADAARLTGDALLAGHKVLLCGNGGSAADAQHIAGEFVGRFLIERAAWPAIALSVNTSVLTAVGNDYGFEKVFARQVEALALPGDVLFGFSTSGGSANVALAMDAARRLGCRTVAMVGAAPGTVGANADVTIAVPSVVTPRVQESHIAISHIICDIVERRIVAAREGKL
jgi:D-sedoheptulose 7-phosphate isomerase